MANQRISDFESAVLLTGGEFVPIIQPVDDPKGNKKITVDQVKEFVKEDLEGAVAQLNITGNISGGAVTIAAGGKRETEVYLLTNSNLNISWTGLNEGGIIYLRIERTTTPQISLNFNGANNSDCFMDGSSQQIGAGSPLLLAGHSGVVGINRRHYRLSIEAVKDITANKLIYLIRVSNTGSITVS